MTQTLTLSGEVYRKLAEGAAERGMTIEALLTAVSELVSLPAQPTAQDRQRRECIERLLDRFRKGRLSTEDRGELDRLIQADYERANAQADQLIDAQERQAREEMPPSREAHGAPRSSKRARP